MNNLVAENLTKIYSPNVTAVEDVSFEVAEGEIVVILGPSGSGKTTLLNLLALLDRPTSGIVRWQGQDISRIDEREMSRLRNETYGFIFQFFHLIPELSVLENIYLPLWVREKKTNLVAYRQAALELLREFDLEGKADAYPNHLSGGEKQRVSIARSLVCDPAVIFADEPTGNLDRKASSDVLGLIEDLNKTKGRTFVVATHNENFLKIATKVIYLRGGRLEKIE
jgi:ABC-type lipoprotein export system ATPase subunit